MQLRAVDWRLILFLSMSALGAVVLWWAFSSAVGSTLGFGFDARAYWGYPRETVYAGPGVSAGYGIYRYSPVFVPLMMLWTSIPWPLFVVGWFLLGVALYVWMVGPWSLALLAIPVFAIELLIGNIHLLLALAIVLGFRWPATWSFVLLTKVTPGIGLLWFVVRREWRSLAIALAATTAIAAVSIVLAPGLWLEWVRSLGHTAEPGTGNTISIPVLWVNGLAMLAGVVALRRGFPEQLRGQLDWATSPFRRRVMPNLTVEPR